MLKSDGKFSQASLEAMDLWFKVNKNLDKEKLSDKEKYFVFRQIFKVLTVNMVTLYFKEEFQSNVKQKIFDILLENKTSFFSTLLNETIDKLVDESPSCENFKGVQEIFMKKDPFFYGEEYDDSGESCMTM